MSRRMSAPKTNQLADRNSAPSASEPHEGDDGHLAVPRADERVRDAAAVELADREQVERGDEEAHPARERDRVHEDVHARPGCGPNTIQVRGA